MGNWVLMSGAKITPTWQLALTGNGARVHVVVPGSIAVLRSGVIAVRSKAALPSFSIVCLMGAD